MDELDKGFVHHESGDFKSSLQSFILASRLDAKDLLGDKLVEIKKLEGEAIAIYMAAITLR
jgi:hypothetical protein